MSRSGPQLYCPNCKAICTCKVVEYHEAKDFAGDYGQRWYRKDHPDINWFRRVRQCTTCDELFTTAELDVHLLTELVILRDRVNELRKKIEMHTMAAKSASEALEQLSTALSQIEANPAKKVAAAPAAE